MRYILLKILLISFATFQLSSAVADSYDDLLAAIKLNDIATAEKLFAKGMDVNTADPSANTLLMLAVRENHVDMVKRLLQRSAKVAAKNRYGETALMLAAASC